MRIIPVKHYAKPNLPTRVELIQQPEMMRPKRKRGKMAALFALIAGCALFSGCGNTPISQDIADMFDNIAIALHLKQPKPQPMRMMGALGYVRPPSSTTAPTAQPSKAGGGGSQSQASK